MTNIERSAEQLLNESLERITEIDPEQARERYDQPDTVFLDVRDTVELQGGELIPGAEHVPRGMIEFKADPTSEYHDPAFDPEKRYVCYCVVGLRSAFVTDRLREMGYEIVNLAGGITAWKEAGYEVSSYEESQSS